MRRFFVALAAAGAIVCAPATDATPELACASYSFGREARFLLLCEGSTDGRRVAEARIRDATGNVIATVTTTVSADEQIVMCGGGKTGQSRPYGPSRATFALTEQLYLSYNQHPDSWRAEVRLGAGWREANMKHVCAAQID